MYESFRNKGQNLPDDEELLKLQKPSLVIYLYPFKFENPLQQLPKLKNVKLRNCRIDQTLKNCLNFQFGKQI